MFFKICILKIFENLTRKYLCWSLLLVNFIKIRLQHRFFPVKFAKVLWALFSRTPTVATFVFCKEFVNISCGNSRILEDSMWLQLIYFLTLSWRRPLSYRNQCIDLLRKSMVWFLYDNDLRHESPKYNFSLICGMSFSNWHLHWLLQSVAELTMFSLPLKQAIMENSKHCIN